MTYKPQDKEGIRELTNLQRKNYRPSMIQIVAPNGEKVPKMLIFHRQYSEGKAITAIANYLGTRNGEHIYTHRIERTFPLSEDDPIRPYDERTCINELEVLEIADNWENLSGLENSNPDKKILSETSVEDDDNDFFGLMIE